MSDQDVITHVSTSTFKSSATRLVAEGLVIVVSILLAFAIDAWWDSSQERSKEIAYLEQLEDDLENTLENNARFGSAAEATDRAVASLVQAYYQAEPAPVDSVSAWWGRMGWAVVQPTLGTVEALVSTGDLTVIRDDELRAYLPNYLKSMMAFEDFEADGAQRYQEAFRGLRRRVDLPSLSIQRLSRIERDSIATADPATRIPMGELRDLPPIDWVAAVYDPEVHHLLDEMWGGKASMRTNRDRMRNASERLLEMVREAKGG